mmetsp:Transcript_97736/g.224095  ORF Transcript_97736/g.224095 Transcript_97736/m.224095 type:complete len:236 (+) Transcript_97736:841-1548(+)
MKSPKLLEHLQHIRGRPAPTASQELRMCVHTEYHQLLQVAKSALAELPKNSQVASSSSAFEACESRACWRAHSPAALHARHPTPRGHPSAPQLPRTGLTHRAACGAERLAALCRAGTRTLHRTGGRRRLGDLFGAGLRKLDRVGGRPKSRALCRAGSGTLRRTGAEGRLRRADCRRTAGPRRTRLRRSGGPRSLCSPTDLRRPAWRLRRLTAHARPLRSGRPPPHKSTARRQPGR